ncbi:concanavalin A-like lectin/glucanase domain-containing protein [Fomes fomentarius]|nr:concanavalin A-like lectin/glucanase domain-containing protein [Fomes fomentarius]
MRTGYAFLSLLPLALMPARPVSATYVLTDTYVGRDFLQSWNWQTMDDPTHGRVNYVDKDTALATNLSFASDDKFVMRADAENVIPPSARGRSSVRINSTKAYDESIIVLDLQHMPEGCGTWPAFWSLSQKGPWPQGGEIDIIEGVNQDRQNLVSLHTMPNCMMPPASTPQRVMTGNAASLNCDTNVNYNQGCGVSMAKPASYGSEFNRADGGYFVVVRTRYGADGPNVRVWFWTRFDPALPPEIKTPGFGLGPDLTSDGGRPSIYPTPAWGLPEAEFPLSDQCEYDTHFDPHGLVFDLTFCGDWAGADYPTSGCPGDCVDYVDNNPVAFKDAYWEVNSLLVYTPV